MPTPLKHLYPNLQTINTASKKFSLIDSYFSDEYTQGVSPPMPYTIAMDKSEVTIAKRKGIICDISKVDFANTKDVALRAIVNDIHGEFMTSIVFKFSETVLASWGMDLDNDDLNDARERLKDMIRAMSLNIDYRPGYEAPLPECEVKFVNTTNPDEVGLRESDSFQSQYTFKVSTDFHSSARKLIYGNSYDREKARKLILKYINIQKKLNGHPIVEYIDIEREMFLSDAALDEVLGQLEVIGAIKPTRVIGSTRPVIIAIEASGSRMADGLIIESGGNVSNIENQYNINNYLNGNDNTVYNNIGQQTISVYDQLKELTKSIDDPEVQAKVSEELKASEEELNSGNKTNAIARLGNIFTFGAKIAPLINVITKLIEMIN